VLRSSSFSKIVAPGIRVGYFVLPADLAAEVEAVAVNVWLAPSYLSQATLHEFLRRGNLEPNVQRISRLLRERRDAMLEALDERFAGGRWSRPEGGYFLWLDLPADADAAELLTRAEAAGVTFVKGSDFYPGGSGGQSSVRLAYSFVSSQEIRDGIGRLGRPGRASAARAAAGAAATASPGCDAGRSGTASPAGGRRVPHAGNSSPHTSFERVCPPCLTMSGPFRPCPGRTGS